MSTFFRHARFPFLEDCVVCAGAPTAENRPLLNLIPSWVLINGDFWRPSDFCFDKLMVAMVKNSISTGET